VSEVLSLDTKAILLLTAPLIYGRSTRSADLLTPGEYKKFARHLRDIGGKPADLLTPDADRLLEDCHAVIDKNRLKRLLARGFLLSQAVEHWQARAIWVVSRADDAYPQQLKARLKEDSPAVLYGCGDRKILNTGGLAVVGSRNASETLLEFTRDIGRLAADAERTLISGGARGVDQAAMRGAWEAGGRVIGVLANGLEKAVTNREHRNLLLNDCLLLISPYDPNAGFNIGHAMQRNKLIYALADAALVVNADFNKGGTWAGAKEQLTKFHHVPVYVRSTDDTNKGLAALSKLGALPWPNPGDAGGFNEALSVEAPHRPGPSVQTALPLNTRRQANRSEKNSDVPQIPAESSSIADGSSDPAAELYEKVRMLVVGMLDRSHSIADVASRLGVTQHQAGLWLNRLTEEGLLEKRTQPVRYVVPQAGLLDEAQPTAASTDNGGNGAIENDN